jgi:hypothetical protein
MSLNVAVRPLPQTPAPRRTEAPRLRPLERPAARRKPKLVYALIALGGAFAIGAAQIALSLAITQDSYTLAELTSQKRELDLRTHSLQEELTGLSSPQALASSAAGLGLVVAGSPSYLRLSDGAVLGTGTGADYSSTVDPNGSGAVGNVLLNEPQTQETPSATDAATEEAVRDPATQLPPSITDGLPTPTTH